MKTQKRLYIILHTITCILAISMVPVSIFLIQIPNYMTILMCATCIITFILCFKATAKKWGRRIILTFLSLLAIAISVLGNYCNPYWNSLNFKGYASAYSKSLDTVLTTKDALEDLEYAMYYLDKLHPAFYTDIPDEVQQRYEEVLSDINEMESISVCELSQKIEYIFSVMRDGHSYVKSQTKDPHYMKDIYKFNQNNCRFVSINGIELPDLLNQTRDLYSYELESWQLRLLDSDLASKEGLQYLGFSTNDGITYTYESEDGVRTDHTYYTEDFIVYDEYVKYNQIEENDQRNIPFVSYEIDKANNIGILTLNSCIYNEEYKACVKEMFSEIKEQGIHNVAVDLRSNGGGDSRVADEFLRYLDIDTWENGRFEWRFGWFKIPFGNTTMTNDKYTDLTYTGEVYLLTSTKSFSSAMLFAQYIKDNELGVIIGEAPGNTPNSYGDIAVFTLPNSQLYMQLSTKEFFRINQESSSNLVEPDIPCEKDDAITVLYETIAE